MTKLQIFEPSVVLMSQTVALYPASIDEIHIFPEKQILAALDERLLALPWNDVVLPH